MPETAIRKWANPTILKWARERMGLNPDKVQELSKEQGFEINATDLIAWENPTSNKEPELSDLEILASIYACPVGYFTMESIPTEEVPLNYRGLAPNKAKIMSYESRLQLRRFISFTEYLALLTHQLDYQEPKINQYLPSGDVQTIASRERDILGISLLERTTMRNPQGLFEACTKKLESLGIFVLSLKLNSREVRGASRWDSQTPPSILVNSTDAEAASGRTFTLLHEYAHLLIRHPGIICDFRGSDKEIEIFCNKFAAEVLVPKNEFKAYLENQSLLEKRDQWSDSLLDKIRGPFLASKDVIAILLEEMDLAPSGFYANKAQLWDSQALFFRRSKLASGHRRTKLEIMRNKLGGAFTSVITSGYDRGIVSSLDLAELLDVRIEKADEFVSWAKKV